jgi:hypothetical protein
MIKMFKVNERNKMKLYALLVVLMILSPIALRSIDTVGATDIGEKYGELLSEQISRMSKWYFNDRDDADRIRAEVLDAIDQIVELIEAGEYGLAIMELEDLEGIVEEEIRFAFSIRIVNLIDAAIQELGAQQVIIETEEITVGTDCHCGDDDDDDDDNECCCCAECEEDCYKVGEGSHVLDMYYYSNKFSFLGMDIETGGNWTEAGYGDCGYALPNATDSWTERAIGPSSSAIGGSDLWWRTPWSKPSDYPNYSYEDYLGGYNILSYEITGPQGPPRALVNATRNCYRPTWYNHSSQITVTLEVDPGSYKVAIYLLDCECLMRKYIGLCSNVTVSTNMGSDKTEIGCEFDDNVARGRYLLFRAHTSDGIITIDVEDKGTEVVLSGIFLDELEEEINWVEFIGEDCSTGGNWRPEYGNYKYLLAGRNATQEVSDFEYINDVTNFTPDEYQVSSGVQQVAENSEVCFPKYPYIGQYSAYEFQLPLDYELYPGYDLQNDERVIVYPQEKLFNGYPPTPDKRLVAIWDSGEFLCDLNYFTIKLEIPEGAYILSLYALEFSRDDRAQTIEIWNEDMTTMLDSRYISDEMKEGVYLRWDIKGQQKIVIKVIADEGNINSFLDGLFINCVPAVGGELTAIKTLSSLTHILAALIPVTIITVSLHSLLKRRSIT